MAQLTPHLGVLSLLLGTNSRYGVRGDAHKLKFFRFMLVGSQPSLSVVISAGQAKDGDTKVRELAVFLREIEPEHIDNGILVISNNENREKISEFHIRDRIAEKTDRSVRIFTGVKFEQTKWIAGEQPSGNLTHCCELHVNNDVLARGCLRVQPRWMEELLPLIGGTALKDLVIPGTHQSGTFKHFTKFNYLNRYRDCQEEDVFTQLLYGIRFLDLRPGAVSRKSSPYDGYEYWIYHDRFYTQNALKPILQDIASFLEIYPKEVVIVAFHEFPKGFESDAAYQGLEKLVEEVLGGYSRSLALRIEEDHYSDRLHSFKIIN
ncbi:uncharacterized protein LOC100899375 [Galendromus occidentalis]|uniref:Uncharacterized protein LOC100899375 n=1 Tax=Galendromus occidentalis TaxID=34638 RepID=A0AAJ7WIJ8_9ACAR|nr:uncharacterized protein LOC100899375 [Galendromus occidentalis]